VFIVTDVKEITEASASVGLLLATAVIDTGFPVSYNGFSELLTLA